MRVSVSSMNLPIVAAIAVVFALLEASVAPELRIGGIQADLVLLVVIAMTMVLRPEEGLTAGFVGGLMLDLLTPGRLMGATTLVMLLIAGAALLARRLPGPNRMALVLGTVFGLTLVYHALMIVVLALAAGIDVVVPEPAVHLGTALLNTALAMLAIVLARAAARRFRTPERDW